MKIIPGKDFHKDNQMEIVLHLALSIMSSVKGYHAYIDIWTPVTNEKLVALIEPHSELHKYVPLSRKKMLLSTTYA